MAQDTHAQPASPSTGRLAAGAARTDESAVRGLAWAGFWLGFGLAMFFDGIILHQILQWHHLLSNVAPDETADDLRFQVLADGVFHLVTYLLAALGLWLLWRNRRACGHPPADHRLVAFGLIGFGVWHIVDAVLVHWILRLHRIRMDVENPLLWDLIWLVPFGVAVAAAGAWLLRRPPPSGGSGRALRAAPSLLALAVIVAGPLSALPPAGAPDDRALVVFRPGMGFAEVLAASEAVGGQPVWSDRNGGLWLIALPPEASASRLYRHGAIMVSNGPLALGCLSWLEA
jgi:uncharacterized membrane protein